MGPRSEVAQNYGRSPPHRARFGSRNGVVGCGEAELCGLGRIRGSVGPTPARCVGRSHPWNFTRIPLARTQHLRPPCTKGPHHQRWLRIGGRGHRQQRRGDGALSAAPEGDVGRQPLAPQPAGVASLSRRAIASRAASHRPRAGGWAGRWTVAARVVATTARVVAPAVSGVLAVAAAADSPHTRRRRISVRSDSWQVGMHIYSSLE